MLLPDLLSGLQSEALSAGQNPQVPASPCQRNSPELWFAESPRDIEMAKLLCAECPLRAACLEGAKERGEHSGVWGGELFVEGVIVARKRGRGRPRKVASAA
ncbi:WhiB family transcriptional regulator [Saxibacter everestensis]|uniref:Transcriptional regulator WhiB n=1 Tax=Saxibacter everestensis TaxID=2909229 RepID=A0ABY8QQJ5_9MICO|nr:WhiB family transcriptional regulator [Brevibacteriaceae bacterium ZFBP1038]